jgi:hypothetical protein
MGAAASPSIERQAEERGRVEQGRLGRCWLGWGGAGQGRARPGRRRPGWRAAGVGRGWGGAGQGRAGRARPGRTRVGQQREQLVAAAARVVAHQRKKERAGTGILTYVHRAVTSADEHKRVGLRDGRGVLCLSATR